MRFLLALIVLAFATPNVRGDFIKTIVEWVNGPPGKLEVNNLETVASVWDLISKATSGNASVETFTVLPWFSMWDVSTGKFPLTGLEGLLANGDAENADPCEFIEDHPEETVAEAVVELLQNENSNTTSQYNTWFLVVSIKDLNCSYDQVLSLAGEAGYGAVIFRNLLANDTEYAPSTYTGNVTGVTAWSIGDSDGLILQQLYSYPESASGRLFDLRLINLTMKIVKIVGMCFGGGVVVAGAATAAVVTVKAVKKSRAAAAAAAAQDEEVVTEKTPLLSPTFVESPPQKRKPPKPGLAEVFKPPVTTPEPEPRSSPPPQPRPKPEEPKQEEPKSEDEYTEEECTICAIMLGLTTPHKHRVLKKSKHGRKKDQSARRYRTQASVPVPPTFDLPNPIPPLARTSSLLVGERSRETPSPPLTNHTTQREALAGPSGVKPARTKGILRTVSFKEDSEKQKSLEEELTSEAVRLDAPPKSSFSPIEPVVQVVTPGPGFTQVSAGEDDRVRHNSEEELATYFPHD